MSTATRPMDKLKPSQDKSPRRVVIQTGSESTQRKPFPKPKSAHLPSRIPREEYVTSFSPIRHKHHSSTFDDESGAWKSVLLPRHEPDNRTDVRVLDEWITTRLADAVAMLRPGGPEGQATSSPSCTQSARVAEEQLKIMDLGFSEIIRQVAIQCSERAELMHRMWRASHELYDTLLLEMSSTIDGLRYSAADWKEKCELLQKQMDLQNWRHEKEMKQHMAASKSNKSEDSQVYREMQEELFLREKDMRIMENTLADLSVWFPNFQSYSTSILRKHLPPIDDPVSALVAVGQQGGGADIILPQDLLYKDLKRLQKLDIGFVVRTMADDADSDYAHLARGNSVIETVSMNGAGSISKPTTPDSSETRDVPAHPPLAQLSPQVNMRKISLLKRPSPDSMNFRSLVVENQLQNVVVEELQSKYASLVEKFREEEEVWGQRIDALSTENSRLKERLEGHAATDALRRLGPILQPLGTASVAWEMIDLFYGKKQNNTAAPPSGIVSVSDIQKCVLQFCCHFLTNATPLSWAVHKGVRNEGGRDITSSEPSWTVTGNMGGIRGAELKVMNFETMFSKYLVQQLGGVRPARERLRKMMWSILVWSHSQTTGEGTSSRFESLLEALPRSIVEHEKGILKAFMVLFGLAGAHRGDKKDAFLHAGMVTLSTQATARDDTSSSPSTITILREPIGGPDEVFLNIFMRCFGSMQRFMRYSPKAGGIASSQAANLFLSGVSSPVPENHLERILTRVFVVSVSQVMYTPICKRRVSIGVAAAAISAGEKVDLKASENNSSIGIGESWWSYLPAKVYAKMKEDVKLLTQKNAGKYAEAFDIIMAIWTNIQAYHAALRDLLENLYLYLDGTVGGPSKPLFNTLLLWILEKKDTPLSSQHKLLPLELIQLSAESRLDARTFADTILSKSDVLLSGLHPLFDGGPRMKREMRREGEQLLQTIKQNYTLYSNFEAIQPEPPSGSIPPATRGPSAAVAASRSHRMTVMGQQPTQTQSGVQPTAAEEAGTGTRDQGFDAVISQADLLFAPGDNSVINAAQSGESSSHKSGYVLTSCDQYYSLQTMKCISLLNQVTKSLCPVSFIDGEAKSARHHNLRLLRMVFRAWLERVDYRRDCSDSEESEGYDDSDDIRALYGHGAGPTGRSDWSQELATIASDED